MRIRIKPFRKADGEEFKGETLDELRRFVANDLSLRKVLCLSAGVFDPIGLVAPFRSGLKNLLRNTMQESSSEGKVQWDEPLSQETTEKWVIKMNELLQIGKVQFPRNTMTRAIVEEGRTIVCFCDAGKLAKCQYIYMVSRLEGPDGEWHVQLIYAKTQVNDVKMSVPNAELDSLHLGAVWLHKVSLAFPEVQHKMLATDSKVACCWVQNHMLMLSVFQRHRVMNILRLVEIEEIFHVAGGDNIADIGSKTEEPHQTILPGRLFNRGPDFLANGPEKAVSDGRLRPIQEVELEEGDIQQVNDGMAAKCRMPSDYLVAETARAETNEVTTEPAKEVKVIEGSHDLSGDGTKGVVKVSRAKISDSPEDPAKGSSEGRLGPIQEAELAEGSIQQVNEGRTARCPEASDCLVTETARSVTNEVPAELIEVDGILVESREEGKGGVTKNAL